MKQTVKISQIENVYTLLNGVKNTKMNSAARRALFGVMYPMKRVAEECKDYRQEAAKRLQPENYQEIADIINEFNGMTPEERAEAIKNPKYMEALKTNFTLDRDFNKCVAEYMEKETELDFEPLTEEVFDALCDSNPDWTLGQCMELQDVLCGTRKEEGGKE